MNGDAVHAPRPGPGLAHARGRLYRETDPWRSGDLTGTLQADRLHPDPARQLAQPARARHLAAGRSGRQAADWRPAPHRAGGRESAAIHGQDSLIPPGQPALAIDIYNPPMASPGNLTPGLLDTRDRQRATGLFVRPDRPERALEALAGALRPLPPEPQTALTSTAENQSHRPPHRAWGDVPVNDRTWCMRRFGVPSAPNTGADESGRAFDPQRAKSLSWRQVAVGRPATQQIGGGCSTSARPIGDPQPR